MSSSGPRVVSATVAADAADQVAGKRRAVQNQGSAPGYLDQRGLITRNATCVAVKGQPFPQGKVRIGKVHGKKRRSDIGTGGFGDSRRRLPRS